MNKITGDTVKKVAKLANLPISSEEEQNYTDQLIKILDYISILQKVDTSNVESTYNTTGLENVWRDDEIEESLEQGVALSNASNKKNGLFLTKGVFEEE